MTKDERDAINVYIRTEARKTVPSWSSAAQPVLIGNSLAAINAERVADEIMARIEREGAIHRSSLIDVIAMVTRHAPQ